MSGPADLDLVRRVLDETGVDQTVAPPGWSGYFQALGEAFLEWLASVFPRLPDVRSIVTKLGPLATALVAVLVLAILYTLLRLVVLAVRDRRASAAGRGAAVLPSSSIPPGMPERDRRGWRDEIDRRLGLGDMAGALEALWWWFARSVSLAGVAPSWTSQELLARSGRRDLAPFVSELDRLLYGGGRPDAEDLRRFLGRLEDVLA